MPDCNHCDEEFDSKKKLAKHYRKQHEDNLSRIEEKLVEQQLGDSFDPRDYAGAFAIGFIIVVVLAAFVYMFMYSGTGSSNVDSELQPTGVGTVHTHGQMNVVVDGQEVDFSQQQYQLQADAFHFESGNGERFHVHAQQVSLEFALETLGFEDVTQNSATFQGTTYSTSDGDTVRYIVNGNEVNPRTYTLQDGDSVRVVLEESS